MMMLDEVQLISLADSEGDDEVFTIPHPRI